MPAGPVELKHYEQGAVDAPAVLLGPSLGTTLAMWDDLATSLADTHRVVRFDIRGHGASPAPGGPYTMAELSADVLALADTLEIERFGYVGISLGGAIGLTLALDAPERLTSLTLCCSAPAFGDPQSWRDRADRVRREGTGFVAETNHERWFTDDFRNQHPETVAELLDMVTSTSPEGYAACCDALAAYDVTDRLAEVSVATRVVSGTEDPVTPPDVGTSMAEAIPGADHVLVEGAAHLVNVAQPERLEAAVREHLAR